ncbi:hypothetical protein ACS0PU_006955 [Formica fusca]
MERAKKMVLISTENLKRIQRMQQQPEMASIAMTNNSPKKNMEISNAENVNNNSNSVRTPGTALLRLDAEMWRILNLATPVDEDKRWKLYKEALQRYLHFVREAKKRLREDTQDNGEDNNDEQHEDTNLDVDDNEFMETSTLISSDRGDGSASSSSSFGKKRAQSAEMIKKILDSVPKSIYTENKARALLKYLIDIPASNCKISWDRRGLVTIDGTVITESNIAELINDAIRERKTFKAAGRIQFARLLHDIATRVWTRLTAIVANTDDHNRSGEHWVAFFLDEHGTGTYFDSYGIPPLHPGFLLRLRRNSIIHRWNIQQNYKEFFLKHVDNIVAYFYIICATVMILIGFLVFLPKIANITIA